MGGRQSDGTTWRAAALAAVLALTGCVATPPDGLATQVPYGAVPGPGKTQTAFSQDDAACRAQVGQRQVGGPLRDTQPGAPTSTQPGGQGPRVGGQLPPEIAYLYCMAARDNAIEPLPQRAEALYPYHPAYGVIADVLYPGPFYGAYGYYGSYFGYGGFGFGFGFRHYGYHRGFGGHHHGFGGGYREGSHGGFRGGGRR